MTGRALVEYSRLLEVLGEEGERLAVSGRGAHPELAVPACPGLTLAETVRHVGSVCRMAYRWMRDGERPTRWQREPESEESLEDYLRTGLMALIEELTAHDPDEPCPTWWPSDQTYGFWCRRMAHEVTVHRIDVQSAVLAGARLAPAVDELDPVGEDIAVDGVDEVLSLWFTHRLAVLGVSGTRHGLVALRTGGREWLARATTTGTAAWRATPEQLTQADATVDAYPQLMYLWLWGRRSTHEVNSEGDVDAIAQLWALLRLATR